MLSLRIVPMRQRSKLGGPIGISLHVPSHLRVMGSEL
jgi:hypothetical protein